ncbi:acetylglutamate kinase [bacterium]|nr:acetylglutamate kinase [bacterium]
MPYSEKNKTFENKSVLFKYGGNAMIDESSKQEFIKVVHDLKNAGLTIVIVHGGGPYIAELLSDVGIESEFIGGHRKTDKNAMKFVEMALSGRVNGEIIKLLNQMNIKAVGLSGKDQKMVRAIKRFHQNDNGENVDLGHVGDITQIDTELINILTEHDYIPVVASIGVGEDSEDYNINADMFAGHLAGNLKVDHYILLTDVDGLYKNIDDPNTLISKLTTEEVDNILHNKIQGGMIPKLESCLIALKKGAKRAYIINGMKPREIFDLLLIEKKVGTEIIKQDGDKKYG